MELQAVIKLISARWPQHRSQVPVAAREYTVAKAELSEHDGLVIKERRIVVLRAMRKEILEKIHEGHQGLTKCREREHRSQSGDQELQRT